MYLCGFETLVVLLRKLACKIMGWGGWGPESSVHIPKLEA